MEGPRPVRPEEFDTLMTLIDEVFVGYPGSMKDGFPLLFNHGNCRNLWVCSDGDRIVSHVGVRLDDIVVLGCRLKIAAVGSVGTHPDYRKRGLASKCLDAAVESAVNQGASVVTISGNRGLYARFGATKVGRSFVHEARAGDAAAGVFLQEATVDDVFKLERIHEREPVRYHRPLEDWTATIQAALKRPGSHRPTIFMVGNADAPTGYALVTRATWVDEPHCRIDEFAGNRADLIGAMPAMAAEFDMEKIQIRVPDFDPALRRAATAAGLPFEVEFLDHHTVKVVNLKAFIAGMKPYIEERLGRSGAGGLAFQESAEGTYDVIIGEEHMPFTATEFTKVAFGQPDRDDIEPAGFGGGLLGRIFPVPRPFPGLNYV